MQTNKLIQSGSSGLNVASAAQTPRFSRKLQHGMVLIPDCTRKDLGSLENDTIWAPQKVYYIRISGAEARHQDFKNSSQMIACAAWV